MFFSRDSLKALAMLTQMGITMIVPIGLGLFAGAFLDRKLGTAPIFLIIFIVLGIAAGFRNIYQMTRKFMKTPAESVLKQEETLNQIKAEMAKKEGKGQRDNEAK
ncbi:AtpZ/AtpI family protein [Clostridiales bacterium COT073_COT-073]|nr:AtpZ/AtpI family protein [Clostridiales bacterium COT073_COT-073]